MSDTPVEPIDFDGIASSVPASTISAVGFEDQELGRRLAQTVANVIRTLGKVMRLERLDGVTIAVDYEAALRDLDRGFVASKPLRVTNHTSIGVAMTPAVIRDGQIRAHIVFRAVAIQALLDPACPGFQDSLYVIAHECAHVQELAQRDTAMPGSILKQGYTGHEDRILGEPAVSMLCEYVVCVLSARFGDERMADSYRQSFLGTFEGHREVVRQAIISYRTHGDLGRLLNDVLDTLINPLRMAAYLAGHLDGMGLDAVAEFQKLVGDDQKFLARVTEMITALRELGDNPATWISPAIYEPLRRVVRQALEDGGIFLSTMENGGLYVDVPVTPETVPHD